MVAANGFVSPSEATDLINDEMPEVYRLLVEVGPPDYYSATVNYTTTVGLATYALPSNFFVETFVYSTDPSNFKRPLLPVMDWSLARVQPPQSAFPITMEYIPAPPVLSADSDTFDGIAGWDSLITARVARRMLQKRKADTTNIDQEIVQLTEHLKTGARRSHGPRYVRDIEDTYGIPYAQPYISNVSNYRVRAGTIEFWQTILAYP